MLIEVFCLESKVRGSDEGRQQVHQMEYEVVEHHEQISHKSENNNIDFHRSFEQMLISLLRTKQNTKF